MTQRDMSQRERYIRRQRLQGKNVNQSHPSLYSTRIPAAGTSSEILYVLHGIFGSGRNWGSVIRRFVQDRPDWQARLIDLRQHGASQGFAPPHTIAAAARDLHELAAAEQETPAAVLGHSFGGKVALMYARAHGAALRQVWLIDATPEARVPDGSAWQMLELIRNLPRKLASRAELVGMLTRAGITTPTAQWMATNLERSEDGSSYHWRFDFDALEEMLRDFFQQDLWSVLEQPPAQAEIHLIKAQQSSVLSPAAVRHIEELERTNGRVHLHEVAGGHWVNAENPDALLALMQQYL